MNKTSVRSSFLFLLTAAIWGVAFVAQSVGMDYIGPFTFNCTRNLIGGMVLIPCIWFLNKTNLTEKKGTESQNRRHLIIGGISCGVCLGFASAFQQLGIQYTTVGKAGFITACYIVLVPVLGIFLKRKCSPVIWLSVGLAVTGLYLLCITESLAIGKGDFLIMICSLLFSLHILVIDHFSPLTDGVKMSCIQFFVAAMVSAVPMLLTETPRMADILAAWQPVLYAGVLSSGVAYTLQIIGQKNMNPTVASLILSLESCISVLAGWLILGQRLSLRELIGCAVMFIAIILAQLPFGSVEH